MRERDVVVIGGGPAGATAARLLATLGHSVALLHAGRASGPDVESLPPSAGALLSSLDIVEAARAASVAPMCGTTAFWTKGEPHVARFDEPGLQIRRSLFDRRLLFAATGAGVDVVPGARVRRVAALGEPVRIAYSLRGVDHELACRVVVDASGRRGTFGRSHDRVFLDGWRTLALVGTFEDVAGDDPSRDTTWIESFDRGWVWTVPLGARALQVTLMIDPPKGRKLSGRALGAFFQRELARATSTAARVQDGRLVRVRAVDASPSFAPETATHTVIRVGDAACNVDPLASFGLKKALASARIGAVVVNTLLRGKGCVDDALAHYQRFQETELSGSMAGAAREVSRARAQHQAPFWQRRTFRPPPERLAATQMRREGTPSPPPGRFRLGPEAHLESRAVIEGWTFQQRPVVIAPRWPDGLRFVEGVSAPAAVEAALGHTRLDDVAERYERINGTAAPSEALRAVLTKLWGWGVLDVETTAD